MKKALSCARFATRADKVLNEADNRPIIESYQTRADKPVIRELYVGALVVAKMINKLNADQAFNRVIFKPQYKKLGGGSQQVALTLDGLEGWVVKVDRESLETQGDQQADVKRIQANLDFATKNYSDPLAKDSTIVVMKSPFRSDNRSCLATLQPKVVNTIDLCKTTPEKWLGLRDIAPHIGSQLLRFVNTTVQLLSDSSNEYLPDLFGPSNLVAGNVQTEAGIYLIDPSPTTKEFLAVDGPQIHPKFSMDEFNRRLEQLSSLAEVA